MPARRIRPSLCWISGWRTSTIFMGTRSMAGMPRLSHAEIVWEPLQRRCLGQHPSPLKRLPMVILYRSALQAGTHEGLAVVALEALGRGVLVAGGHLLLLGLLGRCGGVAFQAAAHEGFPVVTLLAGRLRIARGHALLLRRQVFLGRRLGGGHRTGGKGEQGSNGKDTKL